MRLVGSSPVDTPNLGGVEGPNGSLVGEYKPPVGLIVSIPGQIGPRGDDGDDGEDGEMTQEGTEALIQEHIVPTFVENTSRDDVAPSTRAVYLILNDFGAVILGQSLQLSGDQSVDGVKTFLQTLYTKALDIAGSVQMNGNRVSGAGDPLAPQDYATKAYTDTKVAGIINSAPATLDTLDELADALGDDPHFATTVSTNIGLRALKTTKVNAGTGLSGGGDLTEDRTLSVAYGNTAGTAAQGNDPRLSDARTPTTHSHQVTDVSGLQATLDGKAPSSHSHTLSQISITGTPNGSKFLRDDGSWASVPASAASPTAGTKAALVSTAEGTSSTSWVDLTTTTDQVQVDVGASGMVMVCISTQVGGSANGTQGYMGFALSGANTQAASDDLSVMVRYSTSTSIMGMIGAPFVLTGLIPGTTTFKAKYKAGGGTATFTGRRISVVPL